ncbi:transcription antitermination factor NusB [Fusobacterium sp. PH5-44]|uniref:transcription antitermination factor NusB n=1 Tax=unclassified Fusobacterium TaxID=2648384 RepID=UPI003D223939
MSRKNAREEVFKLIFEGQIKNENVKDILYDYLKREEKTQKVDEIEFITKYLSEIDENQTQIIKKIEENMVGWSLDRIGYVEKAIFICSVYELLSKEIPQEIIINEAIELSKKYGDDKTPDFVNGVLAKLVN